MPELPEVETTRRSLEGYVLGRRIIEVRVRNRRLRWPIPTHLESTLCGIRVLNLRRRAKYLLIDTEVGTALLHLGMSGSLRVVEPTTPPGKHDHVDLVFDNRICVRLKDPRRFGALLWAGNDPEAHPLLGHLGVEPLGNEFSGELLHQLSRQRKLAVKNFIMDARIVVGVGNIYASESLFKARIHPQRAAGRIGVARYDRLSICIRQILSAAITAGGTTLRDYVRSSGEAGGFGTQLFVYGREGQPCPNCRTALRGRIIGQRSSFFCPKCQR